MKRQRQEASEWDLAKNDPQLAKTEHTNKRHKKNSIHKDRSSVDAEGGKAHIAAAQVTRLTGSKTQVVSPRVLSALKSQSVLKGGTYKENNPTKSNVSAEQVKAQEQREQQWQEELSLLISVHGG